MLFAGVGTAGALAVAAKAMPRAQDAVPTPREADVAQEQGGYRLTPHVLRYYQTAKV
jgi:hypothetical protein